MADRSPASVRRSHAGRRWAAAVLVAVFMVLGTTEATGVTKLRATVVRIFTPEGTLVVETDDPAVRVVVEGDGDLVITGAGPQEVRLREGSYQVRAIRDGKRVKLDRDLVNITRGDRQIVRVRLEDEPPAAIAPKAEPGAFVLLAAGKERRFDTLAEAVLSAGDGGTIEIRGNGPFSCPSIEITSHLVIRGADGSRPVLKLAPEWHARDRPLLSSGTRLVLEGLELHRAPAGAQKESVSKAVVRARGSLWAANCRFRSPIRLEQSPSCVLRNCEILTTEWGVGGQHRTGTRWIVGNSILRTRHSALNMDHASESPDALVRVIRSTVVSETAAFWLNHSGRSPTPGGPAPAKRLRLEVSESVLNVRHVLGLKQTRPAPGSGPPPPGEAVMSRLLEWRGGRNVYLPESKIAPCVIDGKPQPASGPKSLDEWARSWAAEEAGSVEGQIRFHGDAARVHPDDQLDRLTPGDFRPRSDSAGYRAGADGKDVGAEVDLVGPGPAYERWKKTPDYRQWLKDTGQVKD